MLNKAHSFKAYHWQAACSSFNLCLRQPIATLMTIIVIAIALALPMLFWVFTDNVSQITADVNEHGLVSLYLQPTLSDDKVEKTLQQVRALSGVKHALLISAQEGLAQLSVQEGMRDVMHALTENPLPALIEITPQTPGDLSELTEQLRAIASIAEVKMDSESSNRLHVLVVFAEQLTYTLLILLAFAVLFIISNTLRLMVQNRYEEIQILKLIGATDSFIARPFLYSGVYYGLLGALVAVLFVNLFVFSLSRALNHVIALYQMHCSVTSLSLRQILILFSFSIILGWLSAYVCVKRQVGVIEPPM